MNRRTFLRNSGAATAGITLFNSSYILRPAAISRDIGIQLNTQAKPLSDDFPGTIKELAAFGYKNLEFAGPYYFSPEDEIKNNVLVSVMGLSGYGYHGHTPREIRMMLDDLGMVSTSAHISDNSLKYAIDEAIEAANIIGQKYILSPAFYGQSLEEFKKASELYNIFGEKCKAGGIQYGYHTHNGEFAHFDGVTPFDILVKETDPALVCFEVDLFWAEVAGVDTVKLVKQYPGRIKLLHIKEMTENMDQPYTTFDPANGMDMLMQLMKNQTIVGEGVIDFKSILSQLDHAGIDQLFIEGDFPDEPMKYAEQSELNLKKILSSLD
jgi:sugar phosphate isomerase/epimerase